MQRIFTINDQHVVGSQSEASDPDKLRAFVDHEFRIIVYTTYTTYNNAQCWIQLRVAQ